MNIKRIIATATVTFLIVTFVLTVARPDSSIAYKAGVGGGQITLSPLNATFVTGQEYDIDVMFSTSGQAISSMAIRLLASSNNFQIVRVSDNPSLVFSNWDYVVKSVANDSRSVDIMAVSKTTTGYSISSSAPVKFATITVKALAPGDVNLTFDLTDSKMMKKQKPAGADITGAVDIFASYNDGNYTATGQNLGSPEPSATSTGQTGSVNIAVLFNGVTTQKPNKDVSVKFVDNGGTTLFEDTSVTLSADASGVYSTVAPITNVPTGTHNVLIKGPSHLTRKFANQTVNAGTNNLNFAVNTLKLRTGDCAYTAGDTYDMVNLKDLTQLIRHYGSLIPAAGSPCDFNFDNAIDSTDYNLYSFFNRRVGGEE